MEEKNISISNIVGSTVGIVVFILLGLLGINDFKDTFFLHCSKLQKYYRGERIILQNIKRNKCIFYL